MRVVRYYMRKKKELKNDTNTQVLERCCGELSPKKVGCLAPALLEITLPLRIDPGEGCVNGHARRVDSSVIFSAPWTLRRSPFRPTGCVAVFFFSFETGREGVRKMNARPSPRPPCSSSTSPVRRCCCNSSLPCLRPPTSVPRAFVRSCVRATAWNRRWWHDSTCCTSYYMPRCVLSLFLIKQDNASLY